jgi:hypothetical protein
MRPNPLYVYKIIGEIVAATNTAVIAELKAYDSFIEKINYQPGTILEINETLVQMSQQSDLQYQRYPLFALLFSFKEDRNKTLGIGEETELTIIIARRSDKIDKVPARYDNNFIPVLYPVYLEFLNQLSLDGRFMTTGIPTEIPHTKTDYPYYDGGDNNNPFDDSVDAILLKIKLKIYTNYCT